MNSLTRISGTVIVTAVLAGCTQSLHENSAQLDVVSLGAVNDQPSLASPSYYPLGAGDAFGWVIFQPDMVADAYTPPTLRGLRYARSNPPLHPAHQHTDYRTAITLGAQR